MTKTRYIKWKGSILAVDNIEASIENEGRLSKIWVTDIKTDRQYLIKSSSSYGYESISEKLAYIVGSSLGFDVLKYDLIEAEPFRGIIKFNDNCKWLSICERLDINGYKISSIKSIKNAINIGKRREEKVTNKEIMQDTLSKEYINNMLIFDAIIGNTDRHYGNVHILLDYSGNICGAPLIDNGASLLATYSDMYIGMARGNTFKLLDKSITTENKHSKQLKEIESKRFSGYNVTEKILSIDNKLQETLELLPKQRRDIVEQYIVLRLHKYITMFK